MEKSHNPPAFPTDGRIQHGTDYDGMDLRDWFAGQAMAGLMASGKAAYNVADTDDCAIYAAYRAYTVADAMLAARKEQG